MRGDMSRTLRLFACAAAMLVVAVGVAAVLKDEPGYEAGRSEVSGKIVGLTEYQEGRDETENASSLSGQEKSVPAGVQMAAPRMVPASLPEPGRLQNGNMLPPEGGDGAPWSGDSGAGEKAASVQQPAAPAENDPAESAQPSGKSAPDVKAGDTAHGAGAQAVSENMAGTAEAEAASTAPAVKGNPGEEKTAARALSDAASKAPAEVRVASASGDTASKKAQPKYERVVTSAKFSMKGSQIKLILQGNAPMVGHCSTLGNPDRVVLDLAGNWELEVPRVPSNRLVQAVRVGQHEDKTRIVLDMKTMGRVALVPVNRNALELSIQ